MKKKKSLRTQLLALVRQQPEWSNEKLAVHLGQTRDTIRGALSILRRQGLLASKPQETEKRAPRLKRIPVVSIESSIPPRAMGSGRHTISGYLKLL